MTLVRALVIVVVLLAFRLVAPLGAECASPTLQADFEVSDAVFLGRAVMQTVPATPPIAWMRRATETTFLIERLWKGEPTKNVRVVTCGGTIGDESITCGETFNFTVGFRYVVFADGHPPTTNTCRHTASVDRAGETLRWLADKPSRTKFENDKN